MMVLQDGSGGDGSGDGADGHGVTCHCYNTDWLLIRREAKGK